MEPFCGSGAVLLARPHPPRVETVNDTTGGLTNAWRATDPETGNPVAVAEVINDLDPYVANVWRSLQADPEATAAAADRPVSELDLHAIHRWLVLGEGAAEFRERLRADPFYYDPLRAGWWLFGASAWIGGGWCADPTNGPVAHVGHDLSPNRPPHSDPARGVTGTARQRRPQLADAYSRGRRVHDDNHLSGGRKPKIDGGNCPGHGVHKQSGGGFGHPDPDNLGTCAQRRAWLVAWFSRLRDRLRTVRVCSGDFLRVIDSESVTVRLGVTGVFCDPPYRIHQKGKKSRAAGLYSTDAQCTDDVNDRLLAWCKDRGGDRRMRICVATYEGDGYEALLPLGWDVVSWESQGGYGNRSKANENKRRERLFFSPHCESEPTLFDHLED